MLDASWRMFYELAKTRRRAYEHERVPIYVNICYMVGFFTGSEKFYDSSRFETVDIYSDVT